MSKEKDSNFGLLKHVVNIITGEEAKIIGVPSELIHFTGKTQKAVFLAQLIYWSDKGSRADGFFYKTYKEWEQETGLSRFQIDAISQELEESRFLKRKLKRANGSPTIHYKLEMEAFIKSFIKFLQDRNPKNLEIESQET